MLSTADSDGEDRLHRADSGASFVVSSGGSSASLLSTPGVRDEKRRQSAPARTESNEGDAKEEVAASATGEHTPEAGGAGPPKEHKATGGMGEQSGVKVCAGDDGGDSEVDVLGVSLHDMGCFCLSSRFRVVGRMRCAEIVWDEPALEVNP